MEGEEKSMNVLLVITTGQTDVQLVRGDVRSELDKKHCAALHDKLEQLEGQWKIVNTPFKKDVGGIVDLPELPFEICTPKLDAIITFLSQRGIVITHALVFETRRDSASFREDPRFAGAIVEHRLRADTERRNSAIDLSQRKRTAGGP